MVIPGNWILFWPFLASVQKQFVNYLAKKEKDFCLKREMPGAKKNLAQPALSLTIHLLFPAGNENWDGHFYSSLCTNKIPSFHWHASCVPN